MSFTNFSESRSSQTITFKLSSIFSIVNLSFQAELQSIKLFPSQASYMKFMAPSSLSPVFGLACSQLKDVGLCLILPLEFYDNFQGSHFDCSIVVQLLLDLNLI